MLTCAHAQVSVASFHNFTFPPSLHSFQFLQCQTTVSPCPWDATIYEITITSIVTIQREKEKKEEMTQQHDIKCPHWQNKSRIAKRLKIYLENDTLKWNMLVGTWDVYSTV